MDDKFRRETRRDKPQVPLLGLLFGLPKILDANRRAETTLRW